MAKPEPSPDYVAFGRLIQKAVGTRKMTEVAKAIGYPHSNLRQAMDGERPMPDDKLIALAEHLGIDIEALIPREITENRTKAKVWKLRQLWASPDKSGRPGPSGQPVSKSGNRDLPDGVTPRSGTVPPSLNDYLEKHGDKVSHKDAQLASRLVFKLDDEAPELDAETFWNGVFDAIRKSRKSS